jgi:PKD repeat protein
MSETGKGKGLMKAIGGMAAGLISGAVLMYATPLFNSFVKPPTPLANFEARQDGTTVTFHNLTSGAASLSGWWDFGDGSPLVQMVAEQDVTHTYAKTGNYSAKLSVHNLINEANERAVALQLDTAITTAAAPRILSLEAIPVTLNAQAPATFKIAGEMQNVEQAVWDLDQGRPLVIDQGSAGQGCNPHQERFVTFSRPGNYTIKLAAFNGEQTDQKLVQVSVKPAPVGALTAILEVTDQATVVEHHERHAYFGASFPPGQKGLSSHFDLVINPTPGWTVADVQIVSAREAGPWLQGKATMAIDPATFKAGPVRNVQLTRAADGKSVHLSGDLLRNSEKEWPSMNLPIVLREEKRKAGQPRTNQMQSCVTLPGSWSLPLPQTQAGWENVKRQVHVKLMDGNSTLWEDVHLPVTASLVRGSQRFTLSAVQNGNNVQFTVTK